MIWTLEFETKAKKSLKKLDASTRQRVMSKLALLKTNPRGVDAIKLVGSESWRIRVGDYRIVYDIHDEVLLIHVIKIGHRREIYR
ncbi:MAG: type II toxin-antitoxin system RelE/ParE family toxin [Verrucomicrobia bacterium]|nr:type II toxin-antitoxin system RelE/ParE family toxin [Verrucomicrobiota bacterium]